MTRIAVLIGLVLGMASVLISTGSAMAEFTSKTKSAHGNGELVEFKLEAGGATVLCKAFTEGAGEATWKITSGGKEAEKGPDLQVHAAKWGKCTAEASGLKGVSAEVSGCELQVEEIKEEVEHSAKLVTTCTIKASECTITLEPGENEKLTNVKVYPSGKEDESVGFEPNVANAVTKVSAGCSLAGVKASKEGKITGAWEMQQVQAQRVVEFTASATRRFYTGANNLGEIIVTVAAGFVGTKPSITLAPTPAGGFAIDAAEVATCEMKAFLSLGESCIVKKYKYNAPAGGARGDIFVAGPNNHGYILLTRGS